MTDKPTLPSVAKFFAKYAEAGHIFPDGGLTVKLRDGRIETLAAIMPPYWKPYGTVGLQSLSKLRVFSARDINLRWTIKGCIFFSGDKSAQDIIAILDDAGNVIAGEVV